MADMSNRSIRTEGHRPEPQQRTPDRVDRIRRTLTAHPWIVDSLLWALPITYLTVVFTSSQAERSEIALVPVVVQVGIVLLQTLPLCLRRTAPLLSSSLIAVGCLLTVLTMMGPTFGIVAVPITVYSTTAWGHATTVASCSSWVSSAHSSWAGGSTSCPCRRRSG